MKGGDISIVGEVFCRLIEATKGTDPNFRIAVIQALADTLAPAEVCCCALSRATSTTGEGKP